MPDAREQAAILALVRAHARGRAAVTTSVLGRVRVAWQRLGNPYDDRAVAAFTGEVGPIVAAGRARTANLTEAYLRRVLAQLGVDAPRGRVEVPALPRGIPLEQEWARPAEHYRYQVSQGATPQDAHVAAARRAQALAETDLSLAMRDASTQTLVAVDRITGWRRIIHPEQSRGGSCGLCVAAATRIYHKRELLPLHANCVPAGTYVAAEGVLGVSRRDYSGQLVVLFTASGQKLTITPNHPVLTDQGWVPAGLVHEGDHVLRSRLGDRERRRGPHEGDRPTLIEEVWRAATVLHGLDARRMPLAPEDFHGDGVDGEVDVVATGGLLSHVGDVSFGHRSGESLLVDGHRTGPRLPGQGGPSESLLGRRDASGGSVRGRGDGLALRAVGADVTLRTGRRVSSAFHAGLSEDPCSDGPADVMTQGQIQFRGAGDVLLDHLLDREVVPLEAPRFDPGGAQFAGEGRHTYAQLGRDLRHRLAGNVELDRLVDKRWVEGSHAVFNLHTTEGWYSAGGLIVSNCACTVLPIVGLHGGSKDPGLTINDVDLGALYERVGGTAAAKLKHARYVVHAHGELGPVLRAEEDAFRGPGAVPATAA